MSIARYVATVAAAKPEPERTKYLSVVQTQITNLSKQLQERKGQIEEQQVKERVAALNAQARAQAEWLTAYTKLRDTEQADADSVRDFLSTMQTSINNQRGRLFETNTAAVERYSDIALQEFNRQNGTNAGAIRAFQKMFGSVSQDPLVSGNSTFMWHLMNAFDQKVLQGNSPDAILGGNGPVLDAYRQKRTQANNHRAALEQLSSSLDTDAQQLTSLLGALKQDPTAAGEVRDLALEKGKATWENLKDATGVPYEELQERVARAREESADADQDIVDLRERIKSAEALRDELLEDPSKKNVLAEAAASMKFRAWAADNGYRLGTVELDDEGNVKSWVPTNAEIRALSAYAREAAQGGRGGLFNRKRTGETIKVRVTQPDKLPIPERGTYNFVTNPTTGEKSLLSDDWLEEDRGPLAPAPARIGVATVNGKRELVAKVGAGAYYTLERDAFGNITGANYIDDTAELDPGMAWHKLAVLNKDGEPQYLASLPDLVDKDTVVANVESATDPPDLGEETTTIYGRRMRMRAGDPPGSVRIRTAAGEHLYHPDDQGVEVQSLAGGGQPSDTRPPGARPDHTERPRFNLAERSERTFGAQDESKARKVALGAHPATKARVHKTSALADPPKPSKGSQQPAAPPAKPPAPVALAPIKLDMGGEPAPPTQLDPIKLDMLGATPPAAPRKGTRRLAGLGEKPLPADASPTIPDTTTPAGLAPKG